MVDTTTNNLVCSLNLLRSSSSRFESADSSFERHSTVGKALSNSPACYREIVREDGEGKGYSLEYPGLENSMDCIVHGVTKNQT